MLAISTRITSGTKPAGDRSVSDGCRPRMAVPHQKIFNPFRNKTTAQAYQHIHHYTSQIEGSAYLAALRALKAGFLLSSCGSAVTLKILALLGGEVQRKNAGRLKLFNWARERIGLMCNRTYHKAIGLIRPISYDGFAIYVVRVTERFLFCQKTSTSICLTPSIGVSLTTIT